MTVPDVSLIGVPYDAHSSFLRGPAGAPSAVRAALDCGSANWCSESGLDLGPLRDVRWRDLGDLALPSETLPALQAIRSTADDVLAGGGRPLSIGGDHLVTWPLVQAVTDHHDGLTILHFDAHPDLYDELDGDRYSHACPFARIMEEGRVRRLVQFGIRTATPHQREQAERFGVEIHDARSGVVSLDDLEGPVYVSIDVDVLDPAHAPGISHYEPGGWTVRQLLDAIDAIRASEVPVVGADLVEINPTRDVNDLTAMVGAKLVRELLDLLLTAPAVSAA